uniref:Uncharacterized protein n=1 Tax=Arundo donax TaxID=35708 RepID=A0A0A9G7I3_ARUDO
MLVILNKHFHVRRKNIVFVYINIFYFILINLLNKLYTIDENNLLELKFSIYFIVYIAKILVINL